VEFSNNISQEELENIDQITAVISISEKHFTIIATADIRADIYDFAVRTNNKILMIKPVERSMEEVFKSLTN